MTIHWICPGGAKDPTFETFLERYTSLSKHFKYDILDPIADPDCLSPYIAETDPQPSAFSLIIESGRRHRLIDYQELFYYYNSTLPKTRHDKPGSSAYMYYNSYPYFIFSSAEQQGYPPKPISTATT